MTFFRHYGKKLILVGIVLTAVILYFTLDLSRYFELSYIKAQQRAILEYYGNNPVWFPFLFFCTYVVMAALSIPGAGIMTLTAGAIFGLVKGTLIVSFASAIGATLAFLIARYLLKDLIHDRYQSKLKIIDQGIERDGGYYLFTLRLVAVFPYFVINLVMGITPLNTWTFYWVSQVGMLPATLVFVNAGEQLAELDSLSGILSPNIIFAFALLGLLPLLTRLGLNWYERKRREKVANPE